MGKNTSTYLSFSFFLLFSLLSSSFTDAATTFKISNQCPYTVWAAAVPGGGRRLGRGQTWFLNMNDGTAGGRIWGRTNCTFDGSGIGSCLTGDCDEELECTGYGRPPNTLAEFSQYQGIDFLDISLVEGFNIPMAFIGCYPIQCSADINGECPDVLRAPGGCNNPCTVFRTKGYCCTNDRGGCGRQGTCGPTYFSNFFKRLCPDSFTYPQDRPTFECPSGTTNYTVVFCP